MRNYLHSFGILITISSSSYYYYAVFNAPCVGHKDDESHDCLQVTFCVVDINMCSARLFNIACREIIFSFINHLTFRIPLAEWLACWTQAQKGPGSNHSRDAVW